MCIDNTQLRFLVHVFIQFNSIGVQQQITALKLTNTALKLTDLNEVKLIFQIAD